MAGLEDMWAHFTLTEEEEGGADIPNKEDVEVHQLAGKFFTKRTLNVDAVARTFKPLWKPAGELKIRDSGDNVLVFEFEDVLDLERVLEYEPWSYDKSLIAFQRVLDVEQIPHLNFGQVTFWVQLHNIPFNNLSQETGEAVGNSIGMVVQVADPEDDGAGGEFLRVRITMDISKPLPRCSRLRSGGRQLGLVGLKYERLPNFCYWCGRVTHGERDCEVWLRGRGKLRREDQQYGEWLRAEPIRQSRKTVAVIPGNALNQPPWWKKNQSSKSNETPAPRRDDVHHDAQSAMEAEHYMDNFVAFKKGNTGVGSEHDEGQRCDAANGPCLKQTNPSHAVRLDEDVVGLSIQENCIPSDRGRAECSPRKASLPLSSRTNPIPLQDCTNSVTNSNPQVSIRTWKKLAREPGNPIPISSPMVIDRRPSIELVDMRGGKKLCLAECNNLEKENLKVVAGSQHHRAQ
ncbi:uncharacterized protein LOC126722475 [Quercus robur]|uniref:uncharacterized protein LOC126722475 n=1 Tax=Quercus robur TaxID=38942 RepID=UPI0021622D56|nr:uncharacterized protein LOC126722475 [Quercus robur]